MTTAAAQSFFKSSAARCKSCHQVNGFGTKIGPDLSQIGKKYERRALLETILEPSKAIAPEFVMHLVETAGGEVHAGFITEQNDKELVLKNVEGKSIHVPKSDVVTTQPQKQSMMPELVLQDITAQDAADLLAFLASLTNADPAPAGGIIVSRLGRPLRGCCASFLLIVCSAARLHAAEPAKENLVPHGQNKTPGPALSPAEAMARMTVPEGFSVELVAAEPDIVNPVAMTFDERGRIWITESLEYPRREPGPGRDPGENSRRHRRRWPRRSLHGLCRWLEYSLRHCRRRRRRVGG